MNSEEKTVDRIAVAIAKAANGDYWTDEIAEWEGAEEWEREAHPENHPSGAYEDREWYRMQARAALEAALTGDDTEWEYMVRSTLRRGPVAGRVIETVPMDEATARVIAEEDDDWERALVRRRKAGPWEPVEVSS